MKFIGFRTLKTGIGAAIAMILARELGLEYAVSAGIITVLSIEKTRKKSFEIALRRIGICLVALSIAIVLFGIFGFNEIVFGVFLLIFIPIAVKFKGEDSIVVNSVLVTHLLGEKSIEGALLMNELSLMLVGVTVALLLNLYMPNIENRIKEEQVYIENNLKEILIRMGKIMKGEASYDEVDMGLVDLKSRLRSAKKLSYINLNNNFLADEKYYVKYMEMRMRQLSTLNDMREHFREDFTTYEQAAIMGEFIDKVANSIYEENPAEDLLADLYKLRETYRSMELPKSREEFESRASLFQFLNDIKQFLKIKIEFIKEDHRP